MDIGSGSAYPSCKLSNFAPNAFVYDGVECASMEGFLQSLKFANPDMQIEVCKLVGRKAKFKGKKKKWYKTQTLYWKGLSIDRHSQDYQRLLDGAFYQLSKNKKFQKALLASENATLKHSIGNTNPNRTILTVKEFCGRLTRIRSLLQSNQSLIFLNGGERE